MSSAAVFSHFWGIKLVEVTLRESESAERTLGSATSGWRPPLDDTMSDSAFLKLDDSHSTSYYEDLISRVDRRPSGPLSPLSVSDAPDASRSRGATSPSAASTTSLTLTGAVFSISAGIVGGPVLGLPLVFVNCGIPGGLALVLAAGGLTAYTGLLLSRTFLEATERVASQDDGDAGLSSSRFRAVPYLGMAWLVGGRWLERSCAVILLVQVLLFLSFGFIVVGSNLRRLFGPTVAVSESAWMCIAAVVVLPLSLQRSPYVYSARSMYTVGQLSKCTFVSLTASAPSLAFTPFHPTAGRSFGGPRS